MQLDRKWHNVHHVTIPHVHFKSIVAFIVTGFAISLAMNSRVKIFSE